MQTLVTDHVSRISLYFSLLAGNLGRRPVRHGLRRQAGSLVRTSLGNLFVTALAQPSVKKKRADPGKGIVGIAVGTDGFGRLKCVEESVC